MNNKIWLVALALVSGCATQYPLPMTAAQLVDTGKPDALVAYLSQPDADTAVCDVRSQGPHVAVADDATRHALVAGLVDAKIRPDTWLACMKSFAKSEPAKDSSALIDAAGRGYQKIISAKDFESSPGAQARLAAFQSFYVDRKNELHGNAKLDDRMFASLRRAVFGQKLGPIATRMGKELLDAVDVEHGLWQGEQIDAGTIAVLGQHSDEPTLQRFMLRLPDTTLRDDAKRSLIDLHIARSPFPEVRDNVAAVEAALMNGGKNKLSLRDHAPTSARIDTTKLPPRAVVVQQSLLIQQATLLGVAPNRGLSVLPALSLRGALQVNVDGVSRPVTVCSASSALDPSPCVDPKDVALGNRALYAERSHYRFVENMSIASAITLSPQHDLVVPVSVGGRALTAFTLALRFQRPADLVNVSYEPSGTGPQLLVDVDHRDPQRLLFNVHGGDVPRLAVTELDDTAGFHIVSKGGTGEPGATGSTGSSGSSGGECSDGGPGGPGGPGGDGGPGGRGGDVTVQVACGDAGCGNVVSLLGDVVRSEGGDGGAGGAGGSGGSGGAGGSGRAATTHTDENGNTVVDNPGCSAGSSGSSGSNGSDGSPGPDGSPGFVSIKVVG